MFGDVFFKSESKEDVFDETRNVDTIIRLIHDFNSFLKIFKDKINSKSILTLDLSRIDYDKEFRISQFVANKLSIKGGYKGFFKTKEFFMNGEDQSVEQNVLDIYDLDIENNYNIPKKKFNGKVKNPHQSYKNAIFSYFCNVKISDFCIKHHYVVIKDIYFFYIQYIFMFLCRWINTQDIDYFPDHINVLKIFLAKYMINKNSDAIKNIIDYFTSEENKIFQVYVGREIVKERFVNSYGFLINKNKFVTPWLAKGVDHFRYKLPKLQYLIDMRLYGKSDIDKDKKYSSYNSARILYNSWAYKYDNKVLDIFDSSVEVHHKISAYDDRLSSLELPKNKNEHKRKEFLRLFPLNAEIPKPIQELLLY